MKYLCEYLSRINSLSVCLEDKSTKISQIKTKNKSLTIETGPITQVIPLGITLPLHHLTPEKHEISLRVPTAEKYTPHNWQFTVPWQASDLANKTIKCQLCGQKLASSSQFRQLPSEYWAELMEFWHCHKPQETHENKKNYNITFDPQPQRPMVSDTYLKFHPQDVPCDHLNPYKIWKWQVSVDDETIGSHIFIASMLRELVNSHAIFSFMIQNESRTQSVLVWIFNVEAQYTLTDSEPCQGLKVFFSTSKPDFPRLMNKRGEVETVTIPDLAVGELCNELERTNQLVPSQLSIMDEFRLGFVSER